MKLQAEQLSGRATMRRGLFRLRPAEKVFSVRFDLEDLDLLQVRYQRSSDAPRTIGLSNNGACHRTSDVTQASRQRRRFCFPGERAPHIWNISKGLCGVTFLWDGHTPCSPGSGAIP